MKLESTKNKYEYKNNYYYNNYNQKDDKFKFGTNFFNSNKNDQNEHFKELDKGDKFKKIEEMYNKNSNYYYKKKEEQDTKEEPKSMFINTKKNNESNFKELSHEGDVYINYNILAFI